MATLRSTQRHRVKGYRLGRETQPLADRIPVDARHEAGPDAPGRPHEVDVLRDGPRRGVGPPQPFLAAGEEAREFPRVGHEHEHVGGPGDEALAREASLEAPGSDGLQAVRRGIVAPGSLVAHDVEVDVIVAERRRGRPPAVIPVHAVCRPENGREILHREAIRAVVADGFSVLQRLDQVRLHGSGTLGQRNVLGPRAECRQRQKTDRQGLDRPRQ